MIWGDKIRNMTDVELATLFSAAINHADYEDGDYDPTILEWILRDVDGGQAFHVPYTGTLHKLKTIQPYYDASESGLKTFEIRKNDRNFKLGDVLVLYEWTGSSATGRRHIKQVTFILSDKPWLPEGYVCMALQPVSMIAVKEDINGKESSNGRM